jgi:hypothetical protein
MGSLETLNDDGRGQYVGDQIDSCRLKCRGWLTADVDLSSLSAGLRSSSDSALRGDDEKDNMEKMESLIGFL